MVGDRLSEVIIESFKYNQSSLQSYHKSKYLIRENLCNLWTSSAEKHVVLQPTFRD